MSLLAIDRLSIQFGGLKALEDVSFSVEVGEVVSLIGPNGAGKTTFFNILTGLYRSSGGEIRFRDKGINPRTPDEVTRLGITRTFQNIRLFQKMTVLENVLVGMHTRRNGSQWGGLLSGKASHLEETARREKALSLLRSVGLETQHQLQARQLSYGQQRKLEMVRALAAEPLLLLLDEPSAGMNPQETREVVKFIRCLQSDGQTILLIEHDMKLVMQLSDRIVVLDHGRKIAEGIPEVIRQHPKVIEAYLGKGAAHAAH